MTEEQPQPQKTSLGDGVYCWLDSRNRLVIENDCKHRVELRQYSFEQFYRFAVSVGWIREVTER